MHCAGNDYHVPCAADHELSERKDFRDFEAGTVAYPPFTLEVLEAAFNKGKQSVDVQALAEIAEEHTARWKQ